MAAAKAAGKCAPCGTLTDPQHTDRRPPTHTRVRAEGEGVEAARLPHLVQHVQIGVPARVSDWTGQRYWMRELGVSRAACLRPGCARLGMQARRRARAERRLPARATRAAQTPIPGPHVVRVVRVGCGSCKEGGSEDGRGEGDARRTGAPRRHTAAAEPMTPSPAARHARLPLGNTRLPLGHTRLPLGNPPPRKHPPGLCLEVHSRGLGMCLLGRRSGLDSSSTRSKPDTCSVGTRIKQ